MKTSKQPLLVCDGAARFLEETLVRSLEGTLFAAISVLFTLAGIAAVFEEALPGTSATQVMASTAAGLVSQARAEPSPRRVAAVVDPSGGDVSQ